MAEEELVLEVEDAEEEETPKKGKKKSKKKELPEGHMTLANAVGQFHTDYPEYANRQGSFVRDRLRKGEITSGVQQDENNRWIVVDYAAFSDELAEVIANIGQRGRKAEDDEGDEMEEVL